MKQVRILLSPNLYSRCPPERMPQASCLVLASRASRSSPVVHAQRSSKVMPEEGAARPVYRWVTLNILAQYLVRLEQSFGGNCQKRFYGIWGCFNPWLEGGGVYSETFYTRMLRPEVQSLTLLYTILDRKWNPFIAFHRKWYPFYVSTVEKLRLYSMGLFEIFWKAPFK